MSDVPRILTEAIETSVWRDPGWSTLKRLLRLETENCPLELLATVERMHHVREQLHAVYLPLPWFCLAETSEEVAHGDSRLPLDNALIIGASTLPGDDVFLALDLRNAESELHVLWYDWSAPEPDRWKPTVPLAMLIEKLKGL